MQLESKTYGLVATGFFIAASVVCVLGLSRFESNMEDVFQWLPDTSAERIDYDTFAHRFGSDDFVVLTWPTCTPDTDLADRIAASLMEGPSASLFDKVVSGSRLLRELEDAGLTREQVLERFRGVYFSEDGRQTCVLVSLTKEGMTNRKKAIASIRGVADGLLSDADGPLLVAGYPQIGAWGDKLIRDSIFTLVIPSCLVSTIAAWFCLQSFPRVLSILIVGGLAAGLSVSAVMLCGAKWGGLSSVIPSLAYILTVSGSLHLTNYARSFDNPSARLILGCGWKPCFFSAITTAAGMLSLCRSSFPAVREFGLFCALGVVISLTCQLVLMPVLIELVHATARLKRTTRLQDGLLDSFIARRLPVLIASLALIILLGLGFWQLEGQLEVERLFSSRSQVIREIAQLEKDLGPVEQTELIVEFPTAPKEEFADRLHLIRTMETKLRELPGVHTTLSLTSSLPDFPMTGGLNAAYRRALVRRTLREARESLAETPYLFIEDDLEAWRISMRFAFLQRTDFSSLSQQAIAVARDAVQTELNDRDTNGGVTLQQGDETAIRIRYTGVSHLYHVAQETVIHDLLMNCATAFVLICPLMIIAVRSLSLGLLAMIPNMYPMIAVYGVIGLVQYPLDIGMTMTASVALGIAVDDTTHFLIRFRDMQRVSPTMFVALQAAYRQCSSAMFQTTLITGLGLLVFIWGPLAVMTRFVLTLVSLLTVALLCDLVMLPALIAWHEKIGRGDTISKREAN